MEPASVVVIGNFDGVHRGHQALMKAAQTLQPDARLVAVTFWPHPMSVVRPGQEPPLLCDLRDRVTLLKACGVEMVKVVDFTPATMAMAPLDFLREVIQPLNPVRVVVGENFRFGHRASGNVDTLRDFGVGQFEVTSLELLTADHHTTSSTEIRRLLAEGDVHHAASHLGRPFRFSGIVVVGHQRGKEFGFPTANLTAGQGFAVPADGVYAGWLGIKGLESPPRWPAAISVGTNPTFDDVPATVVEAHALDHDDLELYGLEVNVDFVERLRGNVKFEGIPELISQIGADVERCREVLGLPARGV